MANRGSNITNQAGVVVQGQHDINTIRQRLRQAASPRSKGVITLASVSTAGFNCDMSEDPSVSRIDPGELVYRRGSSASAGGNTLNGGLPVLSSLNGHYCPMKGNNLTKEASLTLLEDSIVFIGVSVNGTDPLNDDIALQRSQVSIRVSGTVTIQNTTGKNLSPGDIVVWHIPTQNKKGKDKYIPVKARDGVNHNKITLMLKKFDAKDTRWSTLDGPEAANAIARYTVGKVLSFSKSNGSKYTGGLVDILLMN